MTAAFDILDRAARERGDDVWLRFQHKTFGWAASELLARRWAGYLRGCGVGVGDRVVLMMRNCPEFLFAYLGASYLGAVVVPLNPRQGVLVLEHILDDCEPSAIVIDEDHSDVVRRRIERGTIARRAVVRIGTGPEDGLGTPSSGVLNAEPLESSAVFAGARTTIMYTSGTTGPPKGVLVELPADLAVPPILQRTGLGDTDVLYCCLPLFHGNALFVSALGSLAIGATLALAPRFSASGHWDDCRRHGATQFNAIGAIIPLLLKQPRTSNDRHHRVRTVFSSGCPTAHWEEFEQRFGVRLVEWYGIVDYPGNVLNVDGPVGSIGKPVGVDVRIVGDDGVDASPNTVGELLMHSPLASTRSYYRDPAGTSAARPDGWFRTGDLARIDSDGWIWFHGRRKDVVRRRGENISPWEVETAVASHPDVAEAAAYAVPSEFGEDEVMVAVVLTDGATASGAEILDHSASLVAAYAVPRYLDVVDEIPKTETSKIRYGELRLRGITPTTIDRERGAQ